MAKEITSRWEDIGPEQAMKYLESMASNRNVRQTLIDFYASQMRAGLWRPIPQGISLDTDGNMIDGQHRMWAIVEAKITVRMYVSRNVNPEDVVAYDTGGPRSYADMAHYSNWDVDPMTAAIAKILVLGIGQKGKRVPGEVAHNWYLQYKEAIDFALALRLGSRPGTGKSMTVSMAAAFARGWYCVKSETLTRMGEILKTGQIEFDADRAAFVLRDAWLSGRLGTLATAQYLKTEGAIRAFHERRSIRTLQEPANELFQIPKLPPALRFDLVTAGNSPRSGAIARKKIKEQEAA